MAWTLEDQLDEDTRKRLMGLPSLTAAGRVTTQMPENAQTPLIESYLSRYRYNTPNLGTMTPIQSKLQSIPYSMPRMPVETPENFSGMIEDTQGARAYWDTGKVSDYLTPDQMQNFQRPTVREEIPDNITSLASLLSKYPEMATGARSRLANVAAQSLPPEPTTPDVWSGNVYMPGTVSSPEEQMRNLTQSQILQAQNIRKYMASPKTGRIIPLPDTEGRAEMTTAIQSRGQALEEYMNAKEQGMEPDDWVKATLGIKETKGPNVGTELNATADALLGRPWEQLTQQEKQYVREVSIAEKERMKQIAPSSNVYIGATPEGQMVVGQTRGNPNIRVVGNGAGPILPKTSGQVPTAAIENITGALQAWKQLDTMEGLNDITGVGTGSVRKGLGYLGTDKAANTYMAARNQMKLAAQSLIKGIPSNFDVQTVIDTLPDIGLSKEMNQSRIKNSRQIVKQMVKDSIAYYKYNRYAIPPEWNNQIKSLGIDADTVQPYTGEGDPFDNTKKKVLGKPDTSNPDPFGIR